MSDTLSSLSPAKLKQQANKQDIDDTYSRIIAAIKADPTSIFDPSRCQELAALKLTIPERIKTLRFARRQLSAQIDDIKEELRFKELQIALGVREATDTVTNKPLYKAQSVRDVKELEGRKADSTYFGLVSKKKKTLSLLYGYDEEIEYLERIDTSLLEILALSVAQLESYGKYSSGKNSKSPTRNKRRDYPDINEARAGIDDAS